MSIRFGRAKHLLKITLEDIVRHPIWVSAHDDRHDEEWLKPVDSPEGVTAELLRVSGSATIALRLANQDGFAIAPFLRDRLFCVVFCIGGKWVEPSGSGLRFPVQLEAVPTIFGV